MNERRRERNGVGEAESKASEKFRDSNHHGLVVPKINSYSASRNN